jgi:hypothetical protein
MVVALSLKEQKSDVVNQSIRELQQGRDNACGTITLTASVTTTVVKSATCAPTSAVFLQATTADAGTEVGNGTIYVSAVTYGQFTITHANNAQVDRTFFWTVRGGN